MENEIFITITLDSLKELDNPHEIFTREAWSNLTQNTIDRFDENENFDFIKSKQLSELAPHFGILWHQKKEIKLEELFTQNIVDIKNQNKTNTWRARAIALLLTSLYCTSNSGLDIIAEKLYTPTRKEVLESQCDYDTIRIATFKEFKNIENTVANDNYEELVKKLIKTVGKSLIINGNFYNVNVERYIKIFYYRFFLLKGYEDIHRELGIHQGSINNILNKFCEEFSKAFDESSFKLLCRKFENAYEKAFAELDNSDLEKRNERLGILKRFQHYFITDNLADYID